jgi:hypothetical protein
MENRGMGGTEPTGAGWSAGSSPGAGEQGGDTKAKVQQLGESARRQATRRLDSRKGQLSGLLDRLAETLEDDDLGRFAAGYVRRASDTLRNRSSDEIFSTAGEGLRSRPAIVVGAAFLAGFAIARLARR